MGSGLQHIHRRRILSRIGPQSLRWRSRRKLRGLRLSPHSYSMLCWRVERPEEFLFWKYFSHRIHGKHGSPGRRRITMRTSKCTGRILLYVPSLWRWKLVRHRRRKGKRKPTMHRHQLLLRRWKLPTKFLSLTLPLAGRTPPKQPVIMEDKIKPKLFRQSLLEFF